MRENIEKALRFYISNEIETFHKSPVCAELFALAERLGYHVECSSGPVDKGRRGYDIYIDFAVKDHHGEAVPAGEYDEYVDLAYSTPIITIDRKERIRFYSWEEDDDFIDSINWAARELKKKL